MYMLLDAFMSKLLQLKCWPDPPKGPRWYRLWLLSNGPRQIQNPILQKQFKSSCHHLQSAVLSTTPRSLRSSDNSLLVVPLSRPQTNGDHTFGGLDFIWHKAYKHCGHTLPYKSGSGENFIDFPIGLLSKLRHKEHVVVCWFVESMGKRVGGE